MIKPHKLQSRYRRCSVKEGVLKHFTKLLPNKPLRMKRNCLGGVSYDLDDVWGETGR